MTSRDTLAFGVFTEIGIIDQLASHAFTQVLPRSISIAQFGILNHFVRLGHDYRTPAQLAEDFQVSRPTMSNTLSRLERSGLVEIMANPDDGRGKRVSITDKGRTMREQCIAGLAGPVADMNAQVPPELLEKIHPLLTQLREIMDQMRN